MIKPRVKPTRQRPPRERDIEAACGLIAKERGWLFYKMMGTRGLPDRLLVSPKGKHVWVEFKRGPAARLTKAQDARIVDLIRNKAKVDICWDEDTFRRILDVEG